MVYSGKEMDPTKVEQELARERRTKLLNPNDPKVKELWDKTRATVEQIAKPGVNIDEVTETMLIQSLLFAYTDQLSGLPNKKGAAIEVEATAAVAKKLNIPMAVLYMDGKDFSGINNSFGHHVGDQVIEILGEAFDQGVRRSTDIKLHLKEAGHAEDEPNIEVGREGGDEFVAILLGTGRAGAEAVGHRINQILAGFVDAKLPILRETFGRGFEVTFGTAELRDSDESGLAVMQRADDNLTQLRADRGETRRS